MFLTIVLLLCFCFPTSGSRIEQKGKRTHGHGQQCGDCWEEEGMKGLNGNGKEIQLRLN